MPGSQQSSDEESLPCSSPAIAGALALWPNLAASRRLLPSPADSRQRTRLSRPHILPPTASCLHFVFLGTPLVHCPLNPAAGDDVRRLTLGAGVRVQRLLATDSRTTVSRQVARVQNGFGVC